MTTTKNELVYENENYVVLVNPLLDLTQGGYRFTGGYIVVNKLSKITEFATPAMPEALFASEQLNHALLSKGWEWRKEKPEPSELNPELLVN